MGNPVQGGSEFVERVRRRPSRKGVSREIEGNLSRLHRLADVPEVPSFDRSASEAYGRVRSDLERRGQVIGSLDMLIAGHAIARGCTLVTNNEQESRRVEGLRIENWAR